jgi:hypothetical protein
MIQKTAACSLNLPVMSHVKTIATHQAALGGEKRRSLA